ncbi:MAG: DUF4062 domain-containing protein [Truepera sp.]|nr:DUF4062 domain-containing protein [Truepera sp.]
MTSQIVDRLRVFVSSTIKECAAERDAVREAIQSINFEPVLFEDIGARPYPPREVYKARLEDSQIFIGIYKESYGWIAPEMDISGVEDEFWLATDRGMPRLVYIYGTPSCRDERLQSLIDKAKNSGITVWFYTDPAQLEERVRDDLTSVVSNRFADQAVALHEAPKPEEVLDSLIPNPRHRRRRPDVEKDLIDRLNEYGRIVVTGPIGSGKTILLAQLSVEKGWIFVDGQGLNRLELLAQAANAIRERLEQPPITLTTEQAAIRELLKSWEGLPDVPLAVDGASDPLALWKVPEIAANNRKLVLTSRATLGVPSRQRFDLPPLTSGEIAAWVSALRGQHPNPRELADLVGQSGGSPLYLRFYVLGGGTSADLSLQELEIRAFESLPPRAREITLYLALSTRPLSLGDLHALVGSQEGPEAVAEQVSTASGLLRQIRGQVMLVHEHLRSTILDQLHQVPVRLTFFASRLGRFFECSERHLAAFHVYVEAGERLRADQILERAANEAVLMGGGAPAIPVFRRQEELAQESGAFEKQLHALLALAFALRQTGARDDAGRALEQARATAEMLGEPIHSLSVREMEAVIDIGDSPRSKRIAELEALRNSFAENGDLFNAARTGTLLAREYIFGQDFQSAERILRELLPVFDDFGDEYGKKVARLNLAVALSGIEGGEVEASGIAQELQQELAPEEVRAHAVLCNLLTRRYRESGDTAQAAEFALEAIQIGEQLGDQHVIAINRINLGNVRRDEGNLDQALIEYSVAEQAAVGAGLRGTESAANMLIASVHNERGEYRLALPRAQHAAAVARLVGDHILVVRAEEERATALNGLHELEKAVSAYADAATAISALHPGGSRFVSLTSKALHLCTTSERPDLKIQLLKDLFVPDLETDGGDVAPLDVLYDALPRMADTITREDRLLPIVALSMADLLTHAPPLVERRIILQATEALLRRESLSPTTSRPVAVASMLMIQSGNALTLGDVTDIAERCAASAPRIYFKPYPDGAGHWTVRLEIANGVVVSLVQLDDSPKTAITTTVLALLLAGLDHILRQQLLDAECMPRQEVIINVIKREEFEALPGLERPELGDMPRGFVVTESADVTRGDQPPIVVICADQFPTPWRPKEEAFSGIHLVLGELLRVLTTQLLAKAVEPEVLFPKITSIINRIVAVHAHPSE